MKKPLPIGVDNFADVIKTGYYYIDKTIRRPSSLPHPHPPCPNCLACFLKKSSLGFGNFRSCRARFPV